MTTAQAIAALEQSEKLMLTPAEVAPILGCHPYAINVQAKCDPSALGFPVCVMGTRVKIPRLPLIAWLTGKKEKPANADDEEETEHG